MLQSEEEPADAPAIAETVEIVGRLYEANLHTHTYRLRDDLDRTRKMTVGGDLDDRALARRLLGDIVHVVAVSANGGDEPDQLIATSIQHVEPPKTGDYYTWDLATALDGIEPIESIEDLRIPDLDGDEYDSFRHAVND